MSVKYETVACCDLCGNLEAKPIDKKGNIIQCKKCNLRFVSPRPTQENVAQNYDWNYENRPGWTKLDPKAQLVYERRFNFTQRFLQSGKILDVGAGRGEFLSQVKKVSRWECFGTETSQAAVEFAKKRFNIMLSLGQLENLHYPDNSFDAVTLWHVLEHLPYPSRATKEARRILKDDGFMFIAMPNDSWLGRRHFFKNAFKGIVINRLPIKKKLRLKKMYPEIDEEGNKHLFYFTPRTLTRLLKKYGFRIKKYSVDYDFGKSNPKIEREYRFNLLFCNLTGINLGNAILIAAQKIKMPPEKIEVD